jgi:hypothetical protein
MSRKRRDTTKEVTMKKTNEIKVFVAVIQTKYEVMAVADTEEGARTAAVNKAWEYLSGVKTDLKKWEIADYFGVATTELVLNGSGEFC